MKVVFFYITGLIDRHGGLCGVEAQRGDGAAPASHRALPAASQQLPEPLRQHGHGAPRTREAANFRLAPALLADQSQALQQTPTAADWERAGGAERRGERRRRRRRKRRR